MDLTTLIASLTGLGAGLGAFAKAFFDRHKAKAEAEECRQSVEALQDEIFELKETQMRLNGTIASQKVDIDKLDASLETTVKLLGRYIHV